MHGFIVDTVENGRLAVEKFKVLPSGTYDCILMDIQMPVMLSLIHICDIDMDYISFGNGDKNLIIIPGLGDSLKNVKGTAFPFSLMYRLFAKDFKVYVFSRKNRIEKNYSTRDMAADLATVIKQLGIGKASIMGISQGGMIAQYLAIDFPEIVEKLILAVTDVYKRQG